MMIVTVGYNEFAMSPKDAVALSEILQRAERYQKKYHREVGDVKSHYTHHAWEHEEEFQMRLVSDDMFRMAKLAGKPDES